MPGSFHADVPPGPTRVYNDLNALHTDAKGNFDVLLSANRPEGYTGDWWQLSATANKLLLRMVSSDWSCESSSRPRTPAYRIGLTRQVILEVWSRAVEPAAKLNRFRRSGESLLTQLRDVLPRDTPLVTPAQRQAQIRERRLALEQRPLW